MKYPHACTHCGFCCLAQQCPVSVIVHGQRKPGEICPALSFNGDESRCALVEKLGPETMGSGSGCCTLATVIVRGQPFDFAALTPEQKVMAVRQIKNNNAVLLYRRDVESKT